MNWTDARRRRRDQILSDDNDRAHGTPYGYNMGCRCDRCRDAKRAEEHERWLRTKAKAKGKRNAKPIKDVPITLNLIDAENMNGASISYEPPHCAVCGRTSPLNLHHVVFRSHGGKEGPTIMLCGSGNASGCHGLAHSGRLFFRWVKAPFWETWNEGTRGALGSPAVGGGHWECLVIDEPTKVEKAWSMDGWRKL